MFFIDIVIQQKLADLHDPFSAQDAATNKFTC